MHVSLTTVSCFPKDETSLLQYLLFSARPAFFFCTPPPPFPISLTLNPFYLPSSLCVCVALSLFLSLKASVANVSFLPEPPFPHLIDRERSPSSKQDSDARAQTYRGMRLWQRLGHQLGHCFNDQRLFSSLTLPLSDSSHYTHFLLWMDAHLLGLWNFTNPITENFMSKEWQWMPFILFEIILGLEF